MWPRAQGEGGKAGSGRQKAEGRKRKPAHGNPRAKGGGRAPVGRTPVAERGCVRQGSKSETKSASQVRAGAARLCRGGSIAGNDSRLQGVSQEEEKLRPSSSRISRSRFPVPGCWRHVSQRGIPVTSIMAVPMPFPGRPGGAGRAGAAVLDGSATAAARACCNCVMSCQQTVSGIPVASGRRIVESGYERCLCVCSKAFVVRMLKNIDAETATTTV